MSDVAVLEPATIGHNQPPATLPFDAFSAHIEDLYAEAKNFLDGEGVNSEGVATAVTTLMDQLRKAAKDADAARAAEKKPHDDAAKAVQAAWKPLLDKAELAVTVCKRALTPWLQAKEAERQAAAAAARAESERKAEEARLAREAAAETDLDARERAEALAKEAAKAEKAANKAERGRAQTAGGAKAVSLRTYYSPSVTDFKAALLHYLKVNPQAFMPLVVELANADIQAGKRQIPGVEVITEQRPV